MNNELSVGAAQAQNIPVENEVPDFRHEIERIINLGDDFAFDGFQVVRREFFAHIKEPSITFNGCKVYVNRACLQKFPNDDTVHFLVNRDKKILALVPCEPDARDSFAWCSGPKRNPKQMSCKLFFAKIVDMMGWNPDFRYKILGKTVTANGKRFMIFNLDETETYVKIFAEGAEPKSSRSPVYPAEWQNQFGLPYSEHCKTMQINIFDGYAVYSVRDNAYASVSETDNVMRNE